MDELFKSVGLAFSARIAMLLMALVGLPLIYYTVSNANTLLQAVDKRTYEFEKTLALVSQQLTVQSSIQVDHEGRLRTLERGSNGTAR